MRRRSEALSADRIDAEAAEGKNRERSLAFRLLAMLRPEEWALLCVLLYCVWLCVSYGQGFDGGAVLSQYFDFFAGKLLLVFAATRLLFWSAARWNPPVESRGARLKRFLFGHDGGGPLAQSLIEVEMTV